MSLRIGAISGYGMYGIYPGFGSGSYNAAPEYKRREHFQSHESERGSEQCREPGMELVGFCPGWNRSVV